MGKFKGGNTYDSKVPWPRHIYPGEESERYQIGRQAVLPSPWCGNIRCASLLYLYETRNRSYKPGELVDVKEE